MGSNPDIATSWPHDLVAYHLFPHLLNGGKNSSYFGVLLEREIEMHINALPSSHPSCLSFSIHLYKEASLQSVSRTQIADQERALLVKGGEMMRPDGKQEGFLAEETFELRFY